MWGCTHWASLCSDLDADFDHVNGLYEASGSHSREASVEERLDCQPCCRGLVFFRHAAWKEGEMICGGDESLRGPIFAYMDEFGF